MNCKKCNGKLILSETPQKKILSTCAVCGDEIKHSPEEFKAFFPSIKPAIKPAEWLEIKPGAWIQRNTINAVILQTNRKVVTKNHSAIRWTIGTSDGCNVETGNFPTEADAHDWLRDHAGIEAKKSEWEWVK